LVALEAESKYNILLITRCATKNDRIRVLGDNLIVLISESLVNQDQKTSCTWGINSLIFQFFRGLIMALKKGSKGDEVKELQDRLKLSGFYIGAIDGVFGSETETAVKNFQKSAELRVDGVVGPETYDLLLGPGCD
jgi:hypothetical protein